MRLRAVFFAIAALGATGVSAWLIGTIATAEVERRTAAELRAALAEAGQHWAEVGSEGLVATLSGAAPDESAHLRAIEVLHQQVGLHRLEDRTTLRPAAPPPQPEFALEILRNPGDVSLIGLAPGPDTVARVRAVLEAAGIGGEVTDMLETTEHAAPPGWDASLGFGLDVLTEMQRARIAVAPGEVTITAVLSSDTARASMRAALSAAVPDGVALHLDLSAPRPVIAPFRLDFRLAGGEARLLACSAETETAAAEILAAGRAAGLAEEADCTLGLGAPSVGWAAAAVAGIAAVKELGGGRFALSDSQAELTGPTGITADELAAAAGRLAAALPAS
jgi:OOP family OmpA-OmpF porin